MNKSIPLCLILSAIILSACAPGSTEITAQDQNLETPKNTPLEIKLSASGIGLQSMQYQVTSPVNGTLTGTAPNLTYQPTQNFIGFDSFTFTASKGGSISNTATISIQVIQTYFPLDLRGTSLPEEAPAVVNLIKPSNAKNALLTLNTFDADFANEGQLIVNGNTPISLFGAYAVATNNQTQMNITITTPANYWFNGDNTMIFRHTANDGYTISGVSVSFQQ